MSEALDKARRQYQAGDYKQAVKTLEVVGEADGLLELASLLRERTEGRVQQQCEEHMRRAQRSIALAQEQRTSQRLRELENDLQEPVRLARWAREAGLRWLSITRSGDEVAMTQRRTIAAAAAGEGPLPACFIDAVEDEGWRLENVTYRFKPTMIQTSVLRGAEAFMGANPVEGEEAYVHLFRRVGTLANIGVQTDVDEPRG